MVNKIAFRSLIHTTLQTLISGWSMQQEANYNPASELAAGLATEKNSPPGNGQDK